MDPFRSGKGRFPRPTRPPHDVMGDIVLFLVVILLAFLVGAIVGMSNVHKTCPPAQSGYSTCR